MARNLDYINFRQGWKIFLACLTLQLLAFYFIRDAPFIITIVVLTINSCIVFQGRELDGRDFIIYNLPISRAKFLLAKIEWVILSSLPMTFISLWHYRHYVIHPHILSFYFGGLLLAALIPVVLVLYFHETKITLFLISLFTAGLLLGIALISFQYPFAPDVLACKRPYMVPGGTLYLTLKMPVMALLYILCGFYVFCRTNLMEKSRGVASLLGLEFIFIFAWFALLIGGADLSELWYLLFR
ncbi:MAG: hypothetical protein NT106_08470 [Candidatus Sumerlaeota bacterium]|nr:hypothetical protein [Candidatus Sumerlaeota bacterium]